MAALTLRDPDSGDPEAAELEGGEIPDEIQQLALSYLAGDIDGDTFDTQPGTVITRLYTPAAR